MSLWLRINKNLLVCITILICSIGWFCYRMSLAQGYCGREIGDEAEKFVAAMMIESGKHLYGDIFAHHGPLAYSFTSLARSITGATDVAQYRQFFTGFQIVATIAISLSPVFASLRQRIIFVALILAFIASFGPTWRGHMVLYNNLAGFSFLLFLFHGLLPALTGRRTRRFGALLAGVGYIFCFFAAYSYVISLFLATVILALVVWRDNVTGFENPVDIKGLLAGVGLGTMLMMCWLMLYGDPLGYLVYHFYFNQVIYSRFIQFDPLAALKNLHIFGDIMALMLIIMSVFVLSLIVLFTLLQHGKDLSAKWILRAAIIELFALMVLYLNPTGGDGLRLATLCLTVSGLSAGVFVVGSSSEMRFARLFSRFSITVLSLFCLLAPCLPGQAYVTEDTLRGSTFSDEIIFGKIVKQLTSPQDLIAVFTFSPLRYLYSDRQPASGNYYYLPWQAAYAEHPVLNHAIDLRTDLERVRPRVIIMDNNPTWGYKFDVYAAQIVAYVYSHYRRTSIPELYVRSDLAVEFPCLFADMPFKSQRDKIVLLNLLN